MNLKLFGENKRNKVSAFKFEYRKPLNNASGILTETHETPFSGSIYGRTKWDMRQIKIFTYSPALALSNKYLEAIIQSLEPKIFSERFYSIIYFIEYNLYFPIIYLRF